MLNATDKKTFLLGGHQLPYSFFADNGNGENGWIVDFINQLFQNIFKISLCELENEREFWIAYTETQTYPTICKAISNLSCKYEREKYTTGERKRRADFWCQCYDEQNNKRDIWIECKNIWIENILNNTTKIIETKVRSCHHSKIKKAIEQIKTIDIKDNEIKIAFFSTYIYYEVGNKPKDLETICKDAYEKIEEQIQEAYKKAKQIQAVNVHNEYDIVYSILDLRATINDENISKSWKDLSQKEKDDLIKNNPYQIFLEHAKGHENSCADPEGHFMPYMMLVAVIEECSKNNSSKPQS